MVQSIDNRAWITGSVQAISPLPASGAGSLVTVLVERVDDAEGYANLLDWAAGTSLDVLIPDDGVDAIGATVGDRLRCRARRSGPDRTVADLDGLTKLGEPDVVPDGE